jgi:hypothetical protein
VTRNDLIKEIRALDPGAKGLSKMKKVDLQAALDGLRKPAASVETIPLNCADCGAFHPGSVLERTGGACPNPKLTRKPTKASEVHDWRLMFDGPEANDCWKGPDAARWCAVCGLRVGNLSTTLSAPACEGKPEDRVLTVKGIKSFRGMSGYGFNATLYRDGKRLGLVIDEGCGGSLLYRCFKTFAEQAEYERWARVQPGAGVFEPLDMIVTGLVEDYETEAKLKRWCKKKTVVKLKGDPEDSYTTWKRPYTPEFAAQIREKHDVVEIINERFLVRA